MKKIYFLLLLAVSHFISSAQYQRLFDPAKAPLEWTLPAYGFSGNLIGTQKVIYFGRDTLISGDTYHVARNDLFYRDLYYREDTVNGIVDKYGINNNDSIVFVARIMDLSVEKGDTLYYGYGQSLLNGIKVDTTFVLGGRKHVEISRTHQIFLPNNQSYTFDKLYFIEGIGNTQTIAYGIYAGGGPTALICMRNNDSLLYMAPFTDTCAIRGLGINQWNKSAIAFHIYPNPVEDVLWVNPKYSRISPAQYEISDIHGKILAKGIIPEAGKTGISLQSFVSGMYVIRLYDNNHYEAFKFLKK